MAPFFLFPSFLAAGFDLLAAFLAFLAGFFAAVLAAFFLAGPGFFTAFLDGLEAVVFFAAGFLVAVAFLAGAGMASRSRSGFASEAVALGLPDPRLGEAIALVLRPDRSGEEPALRAWLRQQLPNFMQPGPILWRDELPRSPNGKLDRVALRQELMA